MRKVVILLTMFSLMAAMSFATVTMDPVFKKKVGGAGAEVPPTYFANDNLTRGGSVNTSSTLAGGMSIIIPSRNSGNIVRVVDPVTGDHVHNLNMTGVAGGTFVINVVDVADDGKIYVAGLGGTAALAPVYVYEWVNDDPATVPVRISNPVFQATHRNGDAMTVVTKGLNRAVYVVGNNAAARVVAVTSTNGGATWTTSEVGPTRAALGVAATEPFGTLFLKSGSANPIAYNQAGTQLASITAAGFQNGTTSALNFLRHNGRSYLAVGSYASGTSFRHQVLELDMSDFSAELKYVTPIEATPVNANGNGTAAVSLHVIDDEYVLFGLATNNIYGLYTAPRDCAGPYAGLIAMNNTTVIESEGTSITYVLPYDLNTTGTATINILNSSNAVVATFAGTTDSGLNIVDWDGTVDNAGGTPVAIGTGYKVRITVLNETAPGWYVANYNAAAGTGAPDGGPGTLFNGFSMTGAHAQTNKSSELFGLIHARNSFAPYGASILLRGDLQPLAGDGSANRVLRHPSEPAPGSGAQWGGSFLPDSDVVFMAGQTAPYITAGSGLSTNSTNVSTTYTVLTFGRDTKVVEENGTLWAYITAANSVIDKVEIDSNGFPTTNSINVLSPASLGVTLYSKDLEFDADGNLYYLGRNDTTVDAFVYRWDAADVQAITKPYHAPLTAGQATWVITHNSGSNQRGLGLGISCGKIYLACTNAATEVTFEMLEIGDVSTPTLTKTLAAGDIVLSSANRWADGVYGNLDPDGVGHLITHNRSPENVRLLAPGGLTQIVTTSPASQSFNIVSPPPLSVPDWFMHQ